MDPVQEDNHKTIEIIDHMIKERRPIIPLIWQLILTVKKRSILMVNMKKRKKVETLGTKDHNKQTISLGKTCHNQITLNSNSINSTTKTQDNQTIKTAKTHHLTFSLTQTLEQVAIQISVNKQKC